MHIRSTDRRSFLVTSAALALAATAPRVGWASGNRQRILILGGTGGLGPFLVREALAAGHDVTLLNRGVTNPGLFPGLHHIPADRLRPNALRELDGTSFDAAIDTWQGAPRCVAEAASALKDQIRRYVYISSVSVYRDGSAIGGREDAPRLLEGHAAPQGEAPTHRFAERKALAEMAGERALGRRFVALRAHPIALPGFDSRSRPQSYWPMRFQRGGEVLAPGDGDDPVQITDPVYISRFANRAMERGLTGAFNVFRTLPFEEYLSGCKAMWGNDARITWVDTNTLRSAGGGTLDDFGIWAPRDNGGRFQRSHARADATGVRGEPLVRTLRRLIDGFRADAGETCEFGAENSAGGLSPARERELLAQLHR